jgi:hypothetical protein
MIQFFQVSLIKLSIFQPSHVSRPTFRKLSDIEHCRRIHVSMYNIFCLCQPFIFPQILWRLLKAFSTLCQQPIINFATRKQSKKSFIHYDNVCVSIHNFSFIECEKNKLVLLRRKKIAKQIFNVTFT